MIFANGLVGSTGGWLWYSQSIGPSKPRRSIANSESREVDSYVIGALAAVCLGFGARTATVVLRCA